MLRVGLIADLNGSYGSTTYGDEVHLAAASLAACGPDLVLSAGDMVAGQQGGLDYPFRYAFAQGGALFVALDATKAGPLDGEQAAWPDAVLDVDLRPKVVFGHVPPLPFAGDVVSEAIGDDSVEALLVAHGVDVWSSGHRHAFYPGRRGALRLVGLGRRSMARPAPWAGVRRGIRRQANAGNG